MCRKHKNNKLKRIQVILTIIVLFFVAVPIAVKAQSQNKTTYVTVVVQSGDTLWDIASEYTDNRTDVRETIYNIKKLNNMDGGMLVPGQEINIPIK